MEERQLKLLEQIVKEYRDNYDGEYFMYEMVERDELTAVTEAFQENRISREDFYDMSNYLMAKFIKLLTTSICSKLVCESKNIKLKVTGMTLTQLRAEIDESMSKLEDIEQVYKAGMLNDKKHWEFIYKFTLFRLCLASREMGNREIQLENIELI